MSSIRKATAAHGSRLHRGPAERLWPGLIVLAALVAVLPHAAQAQTQTVPANAGPWMFGFKTPPWIADYSSCHKGVDKAVVVQQVIDDFNAHREDWFSNAFTPTMQDVHIYHCNSAAPFFPTAGQWFSTGGAGQGCAIPHFGVWLRDTCLTSNDLTDNAPGWTGNWAPLVNPDGLHGVNADGTTVQAIRELSCPPGFTPRFLGSTFDCTIGDEDICPVGNPICPLRGVKLQHEVDYRVSEPGALEFSRYYRSAGFYSPPGVTFTAQGISPYWQHSYERRLLLLNYSGGVFATYQAPDGKMRHFSSTGAEILNRDGAAARLNSQPDGSWIVVMPNSDRERFDSSGRLISIALRGGATTTIAYGANGLASTVTDQFGRTLTLGYDAQKRLSSVVLPGNSTISYAYDANGNPSTVTYPDGTTKTYTYGGDTSDLLTGIIDETNTTFASYSYDGQRRATSSEHAGGAGRYSLAYNSQSATTVTDPLNQSRTYTMNSYSGVRRLTSVSGPCSTCGRTASSTFDANGNVASRLDFNGNLTCYSRDLTRNLETVRVEGFAPGSTCPANLETYTPTPGTRQRKTSTQWNANYRSPTQIEEPGRRTTYVHDASGNVESMTVLDTTTSASRTWSYTYSSVGQVLTEDGPRTDVADVTTYTYYNCTTGQQCGRLHTITNALGHTTTYDTYNAHGQPLTITDPNAVVTTLTYDLRQRLTSRSVAAELTTFEYWPTGLLKKVTLPDGSSLSYTYDGAHRLTQIADAEGNRMVYTLDAMGNRTAEQVYDAADVLTRTRTRVFNALNQLWKEIGAAGTADVTTVYGYDNNGNQTGVSAPLGRTTVLTYDELNRLTEVADPANQLMGYAYDEYDDLVEVTDPRNLQTSFEHNGFGDVMQESSPDRGAISITYDSAGNVATTTDGRGRTATNGYDAINRIVQSSYGDQTIHYVYDVGANALGRLNSVTDASGSTSWTYATRGRIASKTQIASGVSKTIGYGYNSSGQLVSRTTPSGQLIAYQYLNGRVSSVTLNGATLVSDILYAPLGPTRGWRWGNGVYTVREYDQDGRLTDNNSAGFTSYTYYPDGAVQTISREGADAIGPPGVTTLNSASASNRLASVTGGLTRNYSYDAAGNVLADGAHSFTYNDAGRMVTASVGANQTVYSYNAMGQRVKKSNASGATYFVYDEADHLLGEYAANGELIQEIVWLENIPIASIRLAGAGSQVDVLYIHTDHLNAPAKISAPSTNAIVWRWDHDPYGNGAPNEDPDGNGQSLQFNLRFPGQYFDAETGLHYNYMRDYDPRVGRYVESDPIGLGGGANPYAYANASPSMNVDPHGLLVWSNLESVRPVAPGSYSPIPGEPGVAEDGSSPGFTTADWNIESECVCGGEGQWEFLQFRVNFILSAYINSSLFGDHRAWALRAEVLDHMGDYRKWVAEGQRVARGLEARLKGRKFSSEAECEATAAVLSRMLSGSIRPTAVTTIATWDLSDKHTYGHPNQRP
jgi:RHS repeat-associated protein